MGCHALLQGIFPTRGSNPGLPHCKQILFFFFFVVNFVIHWNETSLSLHVFPIPIPLPTSLSTRSLQVRPEHQVRALVSCIQPGLVICFTLYSIHVSMLFSWNIPPSPSPTESKRLFYKSVSLFLFCLLAEPIGKPKVTGVGSPSLIQGSSWSRSQTRVFYIAGRFFTSWATRKAHFTVHSTV